MELRFIGGLAVGALVVLSVVGAVVYGLSTTTEPVRETPVRTHPQPARVHVPAEKD